MGFTVSKIDKRSAACRAGIKTRDVIQTFNGEPFLDYIDFIFFSSYPELEIEYDRKGEKKKAFIKKDPDEPLGLDFEEGLLGRKRTCANKCLFCFVDQLPKGVRKSLYVKDEDWRYSFIMGNYVTLANLSDEELDRIIRRKASPLYISVHAADGELRKEILGNPKARPLKPVLEKFAKNGISFHAQAVICKGINDGKSLNETMEYLYSLYPSAQTLAIVPSGLTKHRQGLYALHDMDNNTAAQVIHEAESFQVKALKEKGTRFVFASDEIYIKAGLSLPPYEAYEDFAQIENGVGLIRKLEYETGEAMKDYAGSKPKYKKIAVATGMDAHPYINNLFAGISDAFGIKAMVYPIENRFFGNSITVSGLLTGGDICEGLNGKDLGEVLLLPESMLKEGDNVFLDGMVLAQMKEKLGLDVLCIPVDGYDLIEALLMI